MRLVRKVTHGKGTRFNLDVKITHVGGYDRPQRSYYVQADSLDAAGKVWATTRVEFEEDEMLHVVMNFLQNAEVGETIARKHHNFLLRLVLRSMGVRDRVTVIFESIRSRWKRQSGPDDP